MFLNSIRTRNAGLIRFAAELHRVGVIPPNTFVFDRSAVRRNAVRLAQRAKELGIDLYFMAKQFGYDAHLMEAILPSIAGTVAVDWMGAEALARQHVPLKHVGHLVPVPAHSISAMMQRGRPEVWTLFDLEAAEAVNRAASALQMTQQVMLRIAGNNLFPGQKGGFLLERVLSAAEHIARLPGLRLVGVTSYPCFAWDGGSYSPTTNLDAVLQATERLRSAGFQITQINVPGHTSLAVMPLLAHYGATHGEPGHALTGTTPQQALGNCEEEPAALYVSEISALLPSGDALVYGGGLYARAGAKGALVGGSVEELIQREPMVITFPPAQFIDYQCNLTVPEQQRVHTGDTVVMAFRFQLFVQRSYRAIVEQDEFSEWRLLAITPEPYFL